MDAKTARMKAYDTLAVAQVISALGAPMTASLIREAAEFHHDRGIIALGHPPTT